jgi:hypothetical protein
VDARRWTHERDPRLRDLFALSSTNDSESAGHKFVIAAKPVYSEDFNRRGRTFDGVRGSVSLSIRPAKGCLFSIFIRDLG